MSEINYDSARGDVIKDSGIEVGQVYECKKTPDSYPERRFHIQGFCTIDGDRYPDVSVRLFVESEPSKNSDGIMHGWVSAEKISDFLNSATLITNADGTPHVKPNDYRDGDVWQSLITSALYSFWNGACRDVFDVRSDSFMVHKSSLLITEPHEYKLIYRDGQGVIND